MSNTIDGGLPAARSPDSAAVSATTRTGGERERPVDATAPVGNVRLTDAENLQALERQLGAAPASIDLARVDAVRAALADGSYRVDPEQIATRMLDLEHALGK